ncbi:MAG: hypothetical protein GX230_09375, partial [Lentisphaerae bacterium]|nr:hypothetical protein [Lentisphaerota bacterium]
EINGWKLGGASALYRAARAKITGGDDRAWELKHEQDLVLSLRTRSQVAEDPDGVLARGSMKYEGLQKGSLEERDHHFKTMITRDRTIFVKQSRYPRTQDLRKGEHWVPRHILVETPVDFDFRSRPMLETLHEEVAPGYEDYPHVCFETEPYETLEEYQRWREAHDEWENRRKTKEQYPDPLTGGTISKDVHPAMRRIKDLLEVAEIAYKADPNNA